MIKFTFWFLRFLCLVGFTVSVTFINIHNFASAIFHIFGLFAAMNIYIDGLFSHETKGIYIQGEEVPSSKRTLPSLWILFRVIQLAIMLVTNAVTWHYIVVYVAADLVFFAVLLFDRRYDMILVPRGGKVKKTTVEEE